MTWFCSKCGLNRWIIVRDLLLVFDSIDTIKHHVRIINEVRAWYGT